MNILEKFADVPKIETERLTLRNITLDDAEDIYLGASNEEVTRYVTWDTHSSSSDTIKFINTFLPQYDALWGLSLKKMVNLLEQFTLFGGSQNTIVLKMDMFYLKNTGAKG
ncbi:GNAT family N-acetyltransferase [Peribacillus sp. YIM B13477]|uniref:GNAT family N-acetyltransferase n=1 Tax=Peribacillus sp. YIM B13477 TaxID=3366300 RepID=UPI00367337A8